MENNFAKMTQETIFSSYAPAGCHTITGICLTEDFHDLTYKMYLFDYSIGKPDERLDKRDHRLFFSFAEARRYFSDVYRIVL